MWGTSNSWYRIRSYAQAKQAYEETKPLRGNPNFRPLDRRSRDAKQSIRKENNDYIVVCYGTDIVRYRPDGSVLLKTGDYNTRTTAAGLSASSPWVCWRKLNGMVVQLSPSYDEAKRYIISNGGLEVRADSTPVNPVVATVAKTRVNKDVSKKIRTTFAEVAKRIDVYQKAFVGGTRPLGDRYARAGALFRFTTIDEVHLDEPLIDSLAWSYVDCDYDCYTCVYTIADIGKNAVDVMWRELYATFGAIETYYVELPLGRV